MNLQTIHIGWGYTHGGRADKNEMRGNKKK